MSDPIWEQLAVAAAGPVVTAGLALFVINQVTAWAQSRSDAARSREGLATELTETATSLYLALQAFERASRNVPLAERRTRPELAADRELLEAAYHSTRVRGQVLEQRLHIYYADPEPRRLWHATTDLLTVRYFLLLERDDVKRLKIRKDNAEFEHSGLTTDELDDPRLVLDTYRLRLEAALASLWSYDIDRSGGHLRRERQAVNRASASNEGTT